MSRAPKGIAAARNRAAVLDIIPGSGIRDPGSGTRDPGLGTRDPGLEIRRTEESLRPAPRDLARGLGAERSSPRTHRVCKAGRRCWSPAPGRTRGPTPTRVRRRLTPPDSGRPHSASARRVLPRTSVGRRRSATSHSQACASPSGRSARRAVRHSAT